MKAKCKGRVYIWCIVCEMAKSFFSGITEFVSVALCFFVIVGIPALVLYGASELIERHYGEQTRDLIVATLFLCIALSLLVSAIHEWYSKAKEKCDIVIWR